MRKNTSAIIAIFILISLFIVGFIYKIVTSKSVEKKVDTDDVSQNITEVSADEPLEELGVYEEPIINYDIETETYGISFNSITTDEINSAVHQIISDAECEKPVVSKFYTFDSEYGFVDIDDNTPYLQAYLAQYPNALLQGSIAVYTKEDGVPIGTVWVFDNGFTYDTQAYHPLVKLPRRIKAIYIDPGHDGELAGKTGEDPRGGTTKGGVFYDGTSEAQNNLEVALRLKDLCTHAGYKVYMSHDTITGGHSKGNSSRGEEAAYLGVNMYIAIHSNGSSNVGCLVLGLPDGSVNTKIGNYFLDRMEKNTKVKRNGNGYYYKDLTVLNSFIENGGNIKDCLYVEIGEHDDPVEGAYIKSVPGQNAIAQTLFECVKHYVPLK